MSDELNVKAGDKVIINNSTIAVVEKVTPKRFIKVNGNLYYPSGQERTSASSFSYHRKYISEYTEEKAKAIAERKTREKIYDKAFYLCRKVGNRELRIDLATAKKLIELLETTEQSK